ncbi:10 kDa chaperonin 1, chloroplastic-like [Nymphaea colorata]|nr:10 kDa chaperonin 1, chloroplastic-like [Nymphaea colorata]
MDNKTLLGPRLLSLYSCSRPPRLRSHSPLSLPISRAVLGKRIFEKKELQREEMAAAAGFLATSSPSAPRTTFVSPNPVSHKNLNGGILTFSRRSQTFPRINAIATKWDPAKVVPQADRVLVRLEQLPEKSSGGVLLPKSAVKFERYLMGEVLSVGVDVTNVEAGKKVLFSDINAYEVDLGTDAKHCFCKAGDLLALVE